MSKAKAFLVAVSMVPFALGAQNLIKNGDAEADLENWQPDKVQVVTENARSGKKCFKTSTAAVGTDIIPIDGTVKYKYSVWVKSADNKKTDVYLALIPLDADKVQINSQEISAATETETELAEACKAEDTVVKVKDAGKWKLANNIDVIAFNVLDDCKDLPNRNISPVVKKIENKNNVWELTLEKPCGKAYPAGTKIRKHRYCSTYIYPAVLSQFNSNEWKELSGEIKGVSKSGEAGDQFWAGTKFVKVDLFPLGGGTIYFDDWKLEEQK